MTDRLAGVGLSPALPAPRESALRAAITYDPLSKQLYELGAADARRELLERIDGHAWGPDGGSVVLGIVRGWLREPIESATR
jgi:hypothetical protein